jgi:hypothetical protein
MDEETGGMCIVDACLLLLPLLLVVEIELAIYSCSHNALSLSHTCK